MNDLKFFKFVLIGLLIFLSDQSLAKTEASADSDESLWEYGVGLGYAHFEIYPASDQMVDLVLPFPTFQYRGKILRADDQDGARAYLLKGEKWWVELSGNGYPPVLSSKSRAREGMSNIPLSLQLGPRFTLQLTPSFEWRVAVYQAFLLDIHYQRKNGVLGMTEFAYELPHAHFDVKNFGEITTAGSLSYNLKIGSKEFMDTFYTVASSDVKAGRAAYEAEAGVLVQQLIYVQGLHRGKTSLYFGFIYNDYSFAKNRASPLFLSSQSVASFFSLTYTLGKSKKDSVPESQIDGVIY